jgi:glycosyltransferase involved in cell wall biosynthesis
VQIAFYSPLKSPTHPAPSGDRRMARQLISALRHSGHTVDIASELRSFDGHGDPENQTAIRSAAEFEAANIIRTIQETELRLQPEIWFTYHLYYKAPDWIGPKVSESLSLGYVVAEASHAPKRQHGPWAQNHAAVESAIQAADSVLSLAKHDMPCVTPLMHDHARHFHLPPFLEDKLDRTIIREEVRATLADKYGLNTEKQWLLTVAMMRPGDKLNSYKLLARALGALTNEDWQLLIVGDGTARSDVQNSFSSFCTVQDGGSIAWAGQLDDEALIDVYAACDVFVWPAVNEAYGMALLEAQAAGMPVVAGNYGGVPDVMLDEVTGLLVEPNSIDQFANAVHRMIKSDSLRAAFGEHAQAYVNSERSLHQASTIVNEAVLHADAVHRRLGVRTL